MIKEVIMVCWRPTSTPSDVLMHSAKGTTWKNHKYLKKIGNAYIYAKAASKAKKKSKEALKQAYDDGISTVHAKRNVNNVSNRHNGGELPPYLDAAISKGKDAKIWNDVSESYRNHGATQYQNAIMYDHANESYKKLAKQNLSSIPKEMISDGKKVFEKIKSKMSSIKRNLQAKKAAKAAQEAGKKKTNKETEKAVQEAGKKKTEYEKNKIKKQKKLTKQKRFLERLRSS